MFGRADLAISVRCPDHLVPGLGYFKALWSSAWNPLRANSEIGEPKHSAIFRGGTYWKNSMAQTCDCVQESQRGTGLLQVSGAVRVWCQAGKELGCVGGWDRLDMGTTCETCADCIL